ncbi:MAG: site-2 protease family protein [Phycisphaerae bacterium]|nr:site-2 protease family protein [Phycisphaerae bacterium]
MTGWWISELLNNGQGAMLAAWIFWVLVSISLHELGHGYAAIRQGDTTPRDLGHMTVNPVVHMGWFSLIVFAITGLAWGQMPVSPSRFRDGRLGEFLVSGAGPLVNLILSFLCFTVYGVMLAYRVGLDNTFQASSPSMENLYTFIELGGSLNLLLCFFNLLPVPPLDGSTMLASTSRKMYDFMHHPFVQQAGFFVLILVVWRSGVTGRLRDAADTIAGHWIGLIVRVLG